MARGKKGKEKFATVPRVVPVKLTDEEIQARGESLAELEAQSQTNKEEAAAEAAIHRVRGKELGKQIAKLTKEINAKEEEREIQCELRPDYKTNTMRIVRPDTDEVVEERALTYDERQSELFPKGKKGRENVVSEFPPKLSEAKGAEDLGIEDEPPLAPKADKAKRGRRRAHNDSANGLSGATE